MDKQERKEFNKRFFAESDHTGRFVVVSMRTGHKYYVEPLDGKKVKWGDLNPATGKVEGSYGSKYKGSINEKDSLITEENGFKNIKYLKPGQSPDKYIDELDSQYPDL